MAPVARYYNMLVANQKEPFRTTQELVAHAKAHPGKLSYGSSGVGSSTISPRPCSPGRRRSS